ncbi:MAG: hypothetical protein JWQ01_4877 [Massilia sp.]|nr:hypothetical protein [Massilia sp.]
MGRPRTPSNILDARGAFNKNPNRRRVDEPEPNGEIGDAPERFTEDERTAWAEIVGTCAAGVFCKSDRIAIEVASVLLAMFRADPAGIPGAKLARLDSLMARFGMTPSDRSKVSAPKPAAVNPFAAMVGKKAS